MEQYYTPSGNPYGYVPQGSAPPPGGYDGYTPPMINGNSFLGASAANFAPRSNQFTLPGATNKFTPGYVPPPGASQYMPNFQSFQQQMQAAQQPQQIQGAAGGASPQPQPLQQGASQIAAQTAQLPPGQGMNPQGPSGPTIGGQQFDQNGQPIFPANVGMSNRFGVPLRQQAVPVPQFNQQQQQQGPAPINPNYPSNNVAMLLGGGGGGASLRPYQPILIR